VTQCTHISCILLEPCRAQLWSHRAGAGGESLPCSVFPRHCSAEGKNAPFVDETPAWEQCQFSYGLGGLP